MINTKSLTAFFDSHCHLHFASGYGLAFIRARTNSGFGVCGTRPEDWPDVVTFGNAFSGRVFGGVGVHPCKILCYM